jgi:hypothetical protein
MANDIVVLAQQFIPGETADSDEFRVCVQYLSLQVGTRDDGTAFVQENLNIGDWQILFQSWFPLSCWPDS